MEVHRDTKPHMTPRGLELAKLDLLGIHARVRTVKERGSSTDLVIESIQAHTGKAGISDSVRRLRHTPSALACSKRARERESERERAKDR